MKKEKKIEHIDNWNLFTIIRRWYLMCLSHKFESFGTYKTLLSTLESDILKNLKFIWNHSKKKKIVKERWPETAYDFNYNVAFSFSGVNGELVPRFLTSVDSGLSSKVLSLYWPNVRTWWTNDDDVVTLVGPKFYAFFSFFYTKLWNRSSGFKPSG